MKFFSTVKVLLFFILIFGVMAGSTILFFYILPRVGIVCGVFWSLLTYIFSVEPTWAKSKKIFGGFLTSPRLSPEGAEQLSNFFESNLETVTPRNILWTRGFAMVVFGISTVILAVCWFFFRNIFLSGFSVGHGVMTLLAFVRFLQIRRQIKKLS